MYRKVLFSRKVMAVESKSLWKIEKRQTNAKTEKNEDKLGTLIQSILSAILR